MATFASCLTLPASAASGGLWYVVGPKGELLVDAAGAVPRGAQCPLECGEAPILMGLADSEPVWAVGAGPELGDAPADYGWQPLRPLGALLETEAWMLAGRAVQLVEWERTNRFCGRCGAPTVRATHERAMHCSRCGLAAYPRLSPAIIVIVERGDEILLGQGRGFGRMFSALAGFAEPGETLEDTVRREVREEVGVELGDIRYYGSQPWPFPNSLMIGFFAAWRSGEIAVDGEEIVDAGWFGAQELPPIPPPLSIARRLIDDWLSRRGTSRAGVT